MAKKESEGDKKYYRILRILNMLNTKGRVKVSELAQEFNVTTRSIQRDMERINTTQFQLDNPEKGVYTFAPGISLKATEMSSGQLAAFVMLAEISKNIGGTVHKSFKTLFKNIVNSNPWESNFIPIMPKMIKNKKRSSIKDIDYAIDNRKELEIEYFKENENKTVKRYICPLKILFSDGLIYILSMFKEKNYYMKYRLDKIKKLTITDNEFTYPKNIEKIVEDARNIWGATDSKYRNIKVSLKIKDWARDYFLNQEIIGGQKIKQEKDGSLLFTAKVCHLLEIAPHILRWIPHITVLEPKELKKEINTRIKTYLKNAK
ncbi:MAG: WYL domain-containing protein [Elusimicrobiales bacterium]|nr:WYL domain-containing protein [Elusimicrobiales bacterium]